MTASANCPGRSVVANRTRHCPSSQPDWRRYIRSYRHSARRVINHAASLRRIDHIAGVNQLRPGFAWNQRGGNDDIDLFGWADKERHISALINASDITLA